VYGGIVTSELSNTRRSFVCIPFRSFRSYRARGFSIRRCLPLRPSILLCRPAYKIGGRRDGCTRDDGFGERESE